MRTRSRDLAKRQVTVCYIFFDECLDMQQFVYKHQQGENFLERPISADSLCKSVEGGRSESSKFPEASQLKSNDFLVNERCECAVWEKSLVPSLILALYKGAEQEVLAVN